MEQKTVQGLLSGLCLLREMQQGWGEHKGQSEGEGQVISVT